MKSKAVKISKKVAAELNEAVRMKARAKALEDEAKDLTNRAKDILLPLMAAYEMKEYTVIGVGKVGRRYSTGSNIKAATLKEQLLIKGVDIEVIETSIAAATNSWKTEYVQFNRE